MKEVAAISKSGFACPQESVGYLLHMLCIFSVGVYGGSHSRAKRSTNSTSAERGALGLAALCGSHWMQAPTLAVLARSVAHARSAKLDLLLSLACLPLPRACLHPGLAALHGFPLLLARGNPLAPCWPRSHGWLAVQGWKVLRQWYLTLS